jgi:hypothetical protein
MKWIKHSDYEKMNMEHFSKPKLMVGVHPVFSTGTALTTK